MAHTQKVLDQDILDGLRALAEGSDNNLLAELMSMYQSAAPERLSKIKQAFNEKNMKTLGDVAHSLKSSSGNLGAMSIHKLCEQIEHAAHKGNNEFSFSSKISELEEQIGLALTEMKEEMNKNQKAA